MGEPKHSHPDGTSESRQDHQQQPGEGVINALRKCFLLTTWREHAESLKDIGSWPTEQQDELLWLLAACPVDDEEIRKMVFNALFEKIRNPIDWIREVADADLNKRMARLEAFLYLVQHREDLRHVHCANAELQGIMACLLKEGDSRLRTYGKRLAIILGQTGSEVLITAIRNGDRQAAQSAASAALIFTETSYTVRQVLGSCKDVVSTVGKRASEDFQHFFEIVIPEILNRFGPHAVLGRDEINGDWDRLDEKHWMMFHRIIQTLALIQDFDRLSILEKELREGLLLESSEDGPQYGKVHREIVRCYAAMGYPKGNVPGRKKFGHHLLSPAPFAIEAAPRLLEILGGEVPLLGLASKDRTAARRDAGYAVGRLGLAPMIALPYLSTLLAEGKLTKALRQAVMGAIALYCENGFIFELGIVGNCTIFPHDSNNADRVRKRVFSFVGQQ